MNECKKTQAPKDCLDIMSSNDGKFESESWGSIQ